MLRFRTFDSSLTSFLPLIDEHHARHHHRLRLRARLRQSPLDQQLIDALTFHTADITLDCRDLSHCGNQAGRREAVTARGVSLK